MNVPWAGFGIILRGNAGETRHFLMPKPSFPHARVQVRIAIPARNSEPEAFFVNEFWVLSIFVEQKSDMIKGVCGSNELRPCETCCPVIK